MLKKFALSVATLALTVFLTVLLAPPVSAQERSVTDIENLITILQEIVASGKGKEQILQGFDIFTIEGSHYEFIPSEQNAFSTVRASTLCRCGGSKPVIYVQPAGGYEYRWCVGTPNTSAFMDVYKYSGGSLSCSGTVSRLCGQTMPGPVAARVTC